MSTYRSLFRLEERHVHYLPASSGLLVLWRDAQPVSIRRTVNIRLAALQHYSGERQPAPPEVTHFSYEIAAQPGGRISEIAEDLRKAGYRLPA